MSVEYTNIEQALGVLDSVCESSVLPHSLYDWQKDAWVYIRAYIMESQKTSANKQSTPCVECGKPVQLLDIHCSECLDLLT